MAMFNESAIIQELGDAIRLTVEQVGIEVLPPLPGWPWYDVYQKYFPTEARQFTEQYRHRIVNGAADLLVKRSPAARHTDPVTSKSAADGWRPRRGSMVYRMLMAHGHAAAMYPDRYPKMGFTNDEIARQIGLSPTDRGCAWHRHGDLEHLHKVLKVLCDDTGLMTRRPGETGDDQIARVLNTLGVTMYQFLVDRDKHLT